MIDRTRLMVLSVSMAALGLAVACDRAPSPTAPDRVTATAVSGSPPTGEINPAGKSNGQFNEKFTFNPVTYPQRHDRRHRGG